MKKTTLLLIALSLLLLSIPATSTAHTYKVLIIFSYSERLSWDRNVLKGIKSALKGIPINYTYFYMNTKQPQPPSYLSEISSEAINLVEKVKPDLIITMDDNALRLVGKKLYKKQFKLVFGGINASPQKDYGIEMGYNITGILETVYVSESVNLFHSLCPKTDSLTLISPDSYTNRYAYKTLVKGKHFSVKIKRVVFLSKFSKYREVVRSLQPRRDGLFLFGYFVLKDGTSPVLDETVVKWTVTHSKVPEVALFEHQIKEGALCGIVTDGQRHGYRVGLLAKKVLKGTPIGKIPFEHPQIGTIAINIDRAHKLNIQIPFGILMSAKIYRTNLLE